MKFEECMGCIFFGCRRCPKNIASAFSNEDEDEDDWCNDCPCIYCYYNESEDRPVYYRCI